MSGVADGVADGLAGVAGLGEAVELLEKAAALLTGVDPTTVSTTDLNVAMEQLVTAVNRVEAGTARVTGGWDTRQAWGAEGAKSGAAWLRNKCFVSPAGAARRMKLARRVREMPKVEAAWQRGDLSADHVSVLAHALTDRTRDLFERDENMLVGFATSMRFRPFCVAVAHWTNLADPDGAERDAKSRHESRRLHHSPTLGGAWATDGWFDDIAGSEIDVALKIEYDRLFDQDWAEAKARLGREPKIDELSRTPPQRRADAMHNLVCRGHEAATAGSAVPLLNVLIDYPTLAGPVLEHFNNGTVFTPGQIARRLGAADVRRVVFDGPDRVTAIGTRTRFFTGRIRDAVLIRDRECVHPLCDEPVARCEVDHIVPYPCGETSEPNGQALCRYHHNLKTGRPRPRGDPDADPG